MIKIQCTFPAANKYYSKDTNWQSDLYVGLEKDKLYLFKARATKEIDGELVTGKKCPVTAS